MSSDRQDLKIEALRQRVGSLVTQYEDQVADLRVEITLQSQEIKSLEVENERLEAVVHEMEETAYAPEPDQD